MARITMPRKTLPRRSSSMFVALALLATASMLPMFGSARLTFIDAAAPEANRGLPRRSNAGGQASSGGPRFLEEATPPATVAVAPWEELLAEDPDPSPSPTTIATITAPAPTTKAPSKPPSVAPTTKLPTALPTPEPTKKPTPKPTPNPTPEPVTAQPTKKPTQPPSPPPTTSAPTKRPTALPTVQPTKKPTQAPSPPPTTRAPSKRPTALPTTAQPTVKPTAKPSAQPTPLPSKQPTKKPTQRPSQSPSRGPSNRPTSLPTKRPTEMPSTKPTLKPTASPTKQLSLLPSKSPTPQPIVVPTKGPSRTPTTGPTALPSRKPSGSPSSRPTAKPTKAPSHSPTISVAPSTSLAACLQDEFGIEKIYSSGENSSNDWYANWQRPRRLSGNEDPFDVDPFDDLTSVSRNGMVSINDGIATLQRSPRLRIYAGGETGFGDVEMTGYARYLAGGNARDMAGFNLGIQIEHPSTNARCEMPMYRVQLTLDGMASFQKVYREDYRTGKRMAPVPALGNSLPLDRWIGVKFTVRSLSPSSVELKVYLDLTDGNYAGEQEWLLVHSFIDTPAKWQTSGNILPLDDCSASLEDGAVFTGKRMYGVIDNVGNAETKVQWRDVSIRNISSTAMVLACLSETPTASPSMKTSSPSLAASLLPSAAPSVFTSKAPVAQSVESISSTAAPSALSANTPSSGPTKSQAIVEGMLNFKLPLETLLDEEEIATLEITVAEFLQKRMYTREGLNFTEFNATVIAQAVVVDNQQTDTPSNSDPEPRVRLLEGNDQSLIVDVLVTAAASPAEDAEGFPFGNVIHRIISKNSERFYDELFSSDVFNDNESPQNNLESVDLQNNGGNNGKKSVALGSSIAGLVMLLALTSLFVVHRRNHERQAESVGSNGEGPPAVCSVERLEEGDGELSSLDDSFLEYEKKYPANVPHLTGKGVVEGACNAGATSNNGDEKLDKQQADQWSLDDTFPAKQVDLDIGSASTASAKAELMKDSFVPCDKDSSNMMQPTAEEPKSVQSEEESMESGLKRLYEKAMPDGSVGKEDEGLVDVSLDEEEEVAQAPKPSSTRGFQMFNCFADNTTTFEDQQTLTTKKILGQDFKSNATPKVSNTSAAKFNGTVYEVCSPPGGLGLVIDSSNDGPTVHEVKKTSPLFGLVEVGDIILTVDGVDCRAKNAQSLAKWIMTKPALPEQTLTLLGNRACILDQSHDDMSI